MNEREQGTFTPEETVRPAEDLPVREPWEAQEPIQEPVREAVQELPELTPAPEPEAAPPKKKKKKRMDPKKKKWIKRGIAIAVAAAMVAGASWGLIALFTGGDGAEKPLTGSTYMGSIQSRVTGSGVTSAGESATVTCAVTGTVKEVYVSEGDTVEPGDPLYLIESPALNEEIAAAQEVVDSLSGERQSLAAAQGKLTITAPFSGKLMETDAAIQQGSMVSEGTQIARLVDDSVMHLRLLYSYAYQGKITKGMSASVALTAQNRQVSGTVEQVNMIEKITVDGARLFEVVLKVPNPGNLTEGVEATAVITLKDGSKASPYEGSTMTYSRSQLIQAQVGGSCLKNNMMDYLKVSSGAVLVQLSSDEFQEQLRQKDEELKAAQQTLAEKQEQLKSCEATAPIGGTVLSSSFIVGEEAGPGVGQVNIADTGTMYLQAQVDERDVANVSVGDVVEISQYDERFYTGTVTSVSLEGQYENGVSFFPVTIAVDGDETLMPGMYLSFSLLASQADDVVIAPIEAVKYTEAGPCVFVKKESLGDAETVELGEGIVPDGFAAVPVETGLADESGVEIRSGIGPDVEIFLSYIKESGSSWEDQQGMDGAYYGEEPVAEAVSIE